MSALASAAKFNPARAAEYAQQSRIALAGYDACHELAACMLAAALDEAQPVHLLAVGAGGTGQELIANARLHAHWRFTAVDPSAPMLELALQNVEAAGLGARVRAVLGAVEDLPAEPAFDAATLIGVLHHVPGAEAQGALLQAVAARLRPGAPLVLAGNRGAYEDQPLLLAAWAQRWRMHGATAEEVERKLGTIRQGACPPASDVAVWELLAQAGFERPTQFFSSLFWGAWIAFKAP